MKVTWRAAAAALLGMTIMTAGTAAQGGTATPAADCAVTSPEENVQIVEQYVDAVLAGDVETADSLLHDDFEHDLSMEGAEVPNDPGNEDELANADTAAEANHEIVHIVAQDDWVAIDMEYDLTGENLGLDAADGSARVEVMVMARIECGQIAEAHFTANMLEALLEHGYELMPPGGE